MEEDGSDGDAFEEEEGEGEEGRDAVVEDLVRRLDGLRHEDDGEDPVEDVVRGGPEDKVLYIALR